MSPFLTPHVLPTRKSCATFKIYAECHHFSPHLLLPPWSKPPSFLIWMTETVSQNKFTVFTPVILLLKTLQWLPISKWKKKVFTVANKIPQDLYFPDPTLPPLPALLLSPSLCSSHGGHLALMFSLLRPFFPQVTSLLILSASSLCSNDTFQMRPSLTLNNVVTSPPSH